MAITVVSSIGTFNTEGIGSIDITEVNQSLTSGVTEINENISAGEDIADASGGASMLLQTFSIFSTMLGLIFLPYGYLTSIGVPAYLALPIQIVCNVTFVWAVIQWISGKSAKTMD